MSHKANPMMWVFGAVLAVVLMVILCGGCAMAAMTVFFTQSK
jgi:hypothetical protein